MENAPYEAYAIDPNGDDTLLASHYNYDDARRRRARFSYRYEGSGCRIEIWRDGRPVKEEEGE